MGLNAQQCQYTLNVIMTWFPVVMVTLTVDVRVENKENQWMGVTVQSQDLEARLWYVLPLFWTSSYSVITCHFRLLCIIQCQYQVDLASVLCVSGHVPIATSACCSPTPPQEARDITGRCYMLSQDLRHRQPVRRRWRELEILRWSHQGS